MAEAGVPGGNLFKNRGIEIRSQGYEYRPVVIGDDVWIGASCVILPGVTLGKGSVIAAGAVVTKSCLAGQIVAGVPGKVIGKRDDWHDKPDIAES